MMNKDRRLTTGDVMRCCHVSRSTVRRWIQSEKLSAYLHPDGQYRITQVDLIDFLKAYNMPIDEGLLGEVEVLSKDIASFKVIRLGGTQELEGMRQRIAEQEASKTQRKQAKDAQKE